MVRRTTERANCFTALVYTYTTNKTLFICRLLSVEKKKVSFGQVCGRVCKSHLYSLTFGRSVRFIRHRMKYRIERLQTRFVYWIELPKRNVKLFQAKPRDEIKELTNLSLSYGKKWILDCSLHGQVLQIACVVQIVLLQHTHYIAGITKYKVGYCIVKIPWFLWPLYFEDVHKVCNAPRESHICDRVWRVDLWRHAKN